MDYYHKKGLDMHISIVAPTCIMMHVSQLSDPTEINDNAPG